jgi:hypothetical protein
MGVIKETRHERRFGWKLDDSVLRFFPLLPNCLPQCFELTKYGRSVS